MVKYCTSCGAQNEDQAAFCSACGHQFQGQSPSSTAFPQASAFGAASQPSVLTAELGTGAHQHVLTDFYLKDSSGNVLLVARRQSLLHRNYTIVDGGERVTGFIGEKTHLTHKTYSVEDENHNVQSLIQASNLEQRGRPPNCSFEDANGNKLGSVNFPSMSLSFSATGTDGSKIFDASFSLGQGFRGGINAMNRRTYSISLVDRGFSLSTLLGILVAMER